MSSSGCSCGPDGEALAADAAGGGPLKEISPEELRFTCAGSHFILFAEDDDGIAILDFLHVRVDLPAKLALLSSGPEEQG